MTTPTDTEKLMQETVVVLAGGKYEIRHTNGTNLRALRYGECWRDVRGDNLVLALVQRIEELEDHERAQPASVAESEIYAELDRAIAKFPTWPTDPLHALAVLGEEYGELTKAVLQATYEPHKNGPGDVRDEAIQTAAMAIRFVRSLMFYQYERCAQHSQAAPQPAKESE